MCLQPGQLLVAAQTEQQHTFLKGFAENITLTARCKSLMTQVSWSGVREAGLLVVKLVVTGTYSGIMP